MRATSQQMVKLQAGKAAFWKEYKDAHKAATLAYAEARRAGTLRQPEIFSSASQGWIGDV